MTRPDSSGTSAPQSRKSTANSGKRSNNLSAKSGRDTTSREKGERRRRKKSSANLNAPWTNSLLSKLQEKAKTPAPIENERRRWPNVEFEGESLPPLDLSERGLTHVPDEVFTQLNTGILVLNVNNIRQIGPTITKLSYLHELHLDKCALKCGAPTDNGALTPELKKLEHLTVLSIQECNLQYIPPVVWQLTKLKRLLLNRNKFHVLPPEVGQLSNLRHLNMQQCGLMTLPAELALCQQLSHVILHGNDIESLPETFSELRRLKVLEVNYRKFSKLIDAYMQTLLERGQIESEHVPSVIFELRALRQLDLTQTKMNTFPEHQLNSLKQLVLNNNFFTKFPQNVLDLPSLEVLDISHNKLTFIPNEISNLGRLKIFKCNSNELEKFPEGLVELDVEEVEINWNKLRQLPDNIDNMVHLKRLMLSDNELELLPESITKLDKLNTLDLSTNKLQQIPLTLYNLTALKQMHTFENLRRVGLWLYKNPDSNECAEMWKTTNVKRLFEFLKKLAIQRLVNVAPCRLILLGSRGAGKTRLLASLLQGTTTQLHVRQQHNLDTQPAFHYNWRTSNGLKIKITDISGDDAYRALYQFYLAPHSLIILCYNHATLEEPGGLERHILRWLQVARDFAPGSVVKMVATRCDDKYRDYEDEEIVDDILDMVEEFEVESGDAVKAVRRELRTKKDSVCERLNSALSSRLFVTPIMSRPTISFIGIEDGFTVFRELEWELETVVADKALFPYVQRGTPPPMLALQLALNRTSEHIVDWEVVRELAEKQGYTSDKDIDDVLQELYIRGEIIQVLTGNYVLTKPQGLSPLLSSIYNGNWATAMQFRSSKLYQCRGNMSEMSFRQQADMFIKDGLLTDALAQCQVFFRACVQNEALKKKNQQQKTTEDLIRLLARMGIAFVIENKTERHSEKSYLQAWVKVLRCPVVKHHNERSLEEECEEPESESTPNDEEENSKGEPAEDDKVDTESVSTTNDNNAQEYGVWTEGLAATSSWVVSSQSDTISDWFHFLIFSVHPGIEYRMDYPNVSYFRRQNYAGITYIKINLITRRKQVYVEVQATTTEDAANTGDWLSERMDISAARMRGLTIAVKKV